MARIIIRLTISFFLIQLMIACDDIFGNINQDENSIYVDKLSATEMQKLILKPQFELYSSNVNMYQYAYNLHVDLFSGYMATPHSFNENSNNIYKLRPDFNHGPLELALLKVIPNTRLVIESADTEELYQYGALAKILQVISISYATDTYGPVPYRSAKLAKPPYFYDSQEEVYDQMFQELEEAVNDLTRYIKNKPDASDQDYLFLFDKICGAKYENWIKLANSLRLRLAIRISKVQPEAAKKIAEACISHEIGVFSPEDADIEMIQTDIINSLWQMCDWDDSRINASLESILKGYNHPCIEKIIAPQTGVVTNIDGDTTQISSSDPYPQLHGVRMGINSVPGGKSKSNQYLKMSKCNFSKYSALPIFKVAEVSFLKAEGYLRGWSIGNGSARQSYEEGIRCSLAKYNITNENMIRNYLETTSGGFPYIDIYENANSICEGSPLLNNAPVKWDEDASNEEKLQQIITQKWIANFPLSFEAWAEFRRTGYPKLFPVKINDSNGLIDTDIQIRRLPFAKQERDTNNEEVIKAESLLKGPDTGGTRLWWDEDKSNF